MLCASFWQTSTQEMVPSCYQQLYLRQWHRTQLALPNKHSWVSKSCKRIIHSGDGYYESSFTHSIPASTAALSKEGTVNSRQASAVFSGESGSFV